MSRRLSGPVLLLRCAVSMRDVLALVAGLVAVLAFAGTIAPAALSTLLTDAQRHELDQMVPRARDLVSEVQMTPSPELMDGDWAGLQTRLSTAREGMGPLLRPMTARGYFTVTSNTREAFADDPRVLLPTSYVNTSVAPDLDEHVAMIEGDLPAPPGSSEATADLVLSRKAADEMRWPVGEARTLSGSDLPERRYRLSGIYAPLDPDGPFWRQTSAAVVPVVRDDGQGRTVTATAWVSADGTDALGLDQLGPGARTRLWFPFDPAQATSAQAPALVDQLSAFTRTPVPLIDAGRVTVGDMSLGVEAVSATFSTGTSGVLRATQVSAQSLVALTTLLAVGPVVAALCVLVLAVRLVRARSDALLVHTRARGASEGQVALAASAVGALVGIPAAALGAVAAAGLAPGSDGVPWWPGALCAALPVVAMVVAAFSGADQRRPRVPRLALELVVVGATVVSVVAVAQGGAGTPGSGIDPLFLAAPVLVCLSGALGARRLLPLVAAWTASWQRRRTGLVGLVAASRTRDGATSAAAVVALVAATGMAVAAGAAVATLDQGRHDTAWAVAGADLRVSGDALDGQAIASLADHRDVRALTTLSDGSDVRVEGGSSAYASRLLTDATALRDVQGGAVGAVPGVAALAAGAGTDGRIPVVVSETAATQMGNAREIEVDGVEARVVAVARDVLAGVPKRVWVLMDRETLGDERPSYDPPVSVLVAADGDASEGLVEDAEALFPGATVTTPAREAAALSADPAVGGVNAVAWVAAVAAAVLVAVTVVLTLVGGAPARARDLAVVRALGLPARLVRRLPLWEVALVVVTAGVLGVVVGVVLPYAVLGEVDLRPFTGGEGQPTTVLPLAGLVAVAAGLAAMSAAGALVAAGAAGRRDLTTVLRTMEE